MSNFDGMELDHHPRPGDDTEEDQARAAIASALASHSLHPGHATDQHLTDQTHDGDISMDAAAHDDEDEYDQSAYLPDLSTVTASGMEGMHAAGLLGHEQQHEASPSVQSIGGTAGLGGGGVVRGIGGMTEEEIRRKQNRSRAGGRVLPVSSATWLEWKSDRNNDVRVDLMASGGRSAGPLHLQRGAACGKSGSVHLIR
jgi:hypothetical protein